MNTSITLLAGATLIGIGFGEIIEGAVGAVTTGPVFLHVETLKYEDGRITQQVVPHGRDAVRGEWSASIYRGDEWLCGGGGVGTYDGSTVPFTPDDWTGGKCGDLEPGDRGRAVWEWVDHDGRRLGVSAEFVVGG